MSFDSLPSELYSSILDYIPPSDLQPTVLAVSRAIPLSPFPLHHLFQSIRITHPDQAILLYRRLRLKRHTQGSEGNETDSRSELQQIASWVKELSIESWTVDAEIVINLIGLLQPPSLQSLNIWVGANNFTPEHLEEVFSKPLLSLRYLSLRFRPYVQRASYYIFLKGAYFDSTLTALSRWPSTTLPTLSVIQDPMDSTIKQKQDFAQPIVFFRLDLSALLRSPALSPSLTYLRFRIPSRPVVRSLCNTPLLHRNLPSSIPFPDLGFLDLSTSGVLDSEIDILLVRFTALKHIILDGCPVMRGDLHDREWHALGKRCALVGVTRAKEREKALKAWLEERRASGSVGGDGAPALRSEPRKIKPGRKGLSTATISLRSSDTVVAISPDFRPQDAATQHKKLEGSKPKKKAGLPHSKIRVLPSLPSLASLSLTLSPTIEPERHSVMRAEFRAGWEEGVAQLAATRARLRTSAGNGFRVMRVSTSRSEKEEQSDGDSEGLNDLDDVDRSDPDMFGMPEVEESLGSMIIAAPIICFAGPGRDGMHEDNCGHSVAWEVMKDEI